MTHYRVLTVNPGMDIRKEMLDARVGFSIKIGPTLESRLRWNYDKECYVLDCVEMIEIADDIKPLTEKVE